MFFKGINSTEVKSNICNDLIVKHLFQDNYNEKVSFYGLYRYKPLFFNQTENAYKIYRLYHLDQCLRFR